MWVRAKICQTEAEAFDYVDYWLHHNAYSAHWEYDYERKGYVVQGYWRFLDNTRKPHFFITFEEWQEQKEEVNFE